MFSITSKKAPNSNPLNNNENLLSYITENLRCGESCRQGIIQPKYKNAKNVFLCVSGLCFPNAGFILWLQEWSWITFPPCFTHACMYVCAHAHTHTAPSWPSHESKVTEAIPDLTDSHTKYFFFLTPLQTWGFTLPIGSNDMIHLPLTQSLRAMVYDLLIDLHQAEPTHCGRKLSQLHLSHVAENGRG